MPGPNASVSCVHLSDISVLSNACCEEYMQTLKERGRLYIVSSHLGLIPRLDLRVRITVCVKTFFDELHKYAMSCCHVCTCTCIDYGLGTTVVA